jgi:pimeloyl-ACP methyl ester carboxylesterase
MNHHYGQPADYLNLSTASLPYWRLGQGPDLVFVHGWPLDCRTFRGSVQRLSRTHTCHLFDLPGAGMSRWNPETPLGLSAFSNVVEEVVRSLELESTILVGHNSGGGFARMAASRLGRTVRGLVLGNTETPGRYTLLFRALFALGHLPFATACFGMALKSPAARSALNLTSEKQYPELKREVENLFLEPLAAHRGRLEAAMALLTKANVRDFDVLAEAHRRIEAPVHFVWGKRDLWFSLEDAQAMLPGFAGGATLEVVDRGGLLVHEECPDLFAEAIERMASEVYQGVAVRR